jgi:hypothetical protein
MKFHEHLTFFHEKKCHEILWTFDGFFFHENSFRNFHEIFHEISWTFDRNFFFHEKSFGNVHEIFHEIYEHVTVFFFFMKTSFMKFHKISWLHGRIFASLRGLRVSPLVRTKCALIWFGLVSYHICSFVNGHAIAFISVCKTVRWSYIISLVYDSMIMCWYYCVVVNKVNKNT